MTMREVLEGSRSVGNRQRAVGKKNRARYGLLLTYKKGITENSISGWRGDIQEQRSTFEACGQAACKGWQKKMKTGLRTTKSRLNCLWRG